MMISYKWNIRIIFLSGLMLVLMMSGCGSVAQQIREKNREEYLLRNSGALDPKVGSNIHYITHKFNFLEKYWVNHDWPKGMNACGYSTIELPESQQNGYWYGSYHRLGDVFEYKGKTLQEVRVDDYPERSYDASFMSIDNNVRTWKKVDGLGVERTYGYKPICWQPLGGTSHTLVVRLYKRTIQQWRSSLEKSSPNGVFSMRRVGQNNWLTQEFELKPSAINTIAGTFKTWILPIHDTGYTYAFQLGASSESLKHPRTHATMKNIFKHLIESVKIKPLSKDEEKISRGKVKKLIQEIEEYDARKNKR